MQFHEVDNNFWAWPSKFLFTSCIQLVSRDPFSAKSIYSKYTWPACSYSDSIWRVFSHFSMCEVWLIIFKEVVKCNSNKLLYSHTWFGKERAMSVVSFSKAGFTHITLALAWLIVQIHLQTTLFAIWNSCQNIATDQKISACFKWTTDSKHFVHLGKSPFNFLFAWLRSIFISFCWLLIPSFMFPPELSFFLFWCFVLIFV